MSFAKPKAVHGSGLDDYKKLLCTHPGCGRIWSVNFDRPKCRLHQFGDDTTGYQTLNFDPFDLSVGTDGKQWARRIIKAHEAGQSVRPIALKFAREALRLQVAV